MIVLDFLNKIFEFDFAKRIIITVIIFVLTVIFIRIIKAVITKSFKKANSQRSDTIKKLLHSVAQYTIWILALMIFMQKVLTIDPTALIATAGIAGVAIGFGAQSFVKDVISGAFILFEDQCNVGDLVTIDGFTGTVIEIGFRTLKIKNYEGDVLYYPNGSVAKMINHSKFDRCVLIDIPISYEIDFKRAEDILIETFNDFFEKEDTITEHPKILGVNELSSSNFFIKIEIKCKAGAQFALKRSALQLIKEAFDKNNIEIPCQKMIVYQTQKKEA